MSSLNGRPVKTVRLHTPTHAEGLGSLVSPITTNSGKTLGKAKIVYWDGGALLTVGPITHYIPGGNIVGMDLEPESK